MTALKVNGKARQLDVPDDMPLLWVLRDVLGMTGTKFGCGVALCGACTVHIDGSPVRSLRHPGLGVGGKRRHHDRGDRRDAARARRSSRRGWTLDVVQCGYCQSGQIMSASGAAASNAEAQRRRHRRRDGGQRLPLRHLPRIRAGHQRAAA